jgi:hypothetical protein
VFTFGGCGDASAEHSPGKMRNSVLWLTNRNRMSLILRRQQGLERRFAGSDHTNEGTALVALFNRAAKFAALAAVILAT